VILFVVFVFLFQDLIAGFEYLPWPPVPLFSPRALILDVDPRESGFVEERALCFAVEIACNVCFLQVGQCLLVSFGNFIFIFDQYSIALGAYRSH